MDRSIIFLRFQALVSSYDPQVCSCLEFSEVVLARLGLNSLTQVVNVLLPTQLTSVTRQLLCCDREVKTLTQCWPIPIVGSRLFEIVPHLHLDAVYNFH